MNKFIYQATERIRSRLPGKKTFYNLSDLQEANISDFVYDCIKRELISRLYKNMEMPLTEWADLNKEPVQKAWQDFLKTTEDHVRLPDYKVKNTIKKIINRWLPLIVWPRTQLTKFLFGQQQEQDLPTIKKKIKHLMVNRQLVKAVVRYMEKKEMDRISHEKCDDVIRKFDDRLTERFTTQQWKKSIQPLFDLGCGSVPSDLLASYFYNRGKKGWSNELAQMGTKLSEEDFDQWLGNKQQQEESNDNPGEVNSPFTTTKPEDADLGGDLNRQFSDQVKSSGKDKEVEAGTMQSESTESDEEEKEAAKHEKEEPKRDAAKGEDEEVMESLEGKMQADSEKEDVPIWKKFQAAAEEEPEWPADLEMGDMEITSSESDEPEEQVNELYKEHQVTEKASKAEREMLEYLDNEKKYLIKELFRGSATDFDQAMRGLAKCNNWRQAYQYIDKEIFDRYDIDLYSEPAVYFTDLMQDYFRSGQNSAG